MGYGFPWFAELILAYPFHGIYRLFGCPIISDSPAVTYSMGGPISISSVEVKATRN